MCRLFFYIIRDMPEKTASLLALEASLQSGDDVGSFIMSEAREVGPSISTSDMALIKKWMPGEVNQENIVSWPVLLIDDSATRNHMTYSAESQRISVASWVGKPFLFNDSNVMDGDHEVKASSQKARIFKSELVTTPWNTTGTLAHVFTVRNSGAADIDAFIGKMESGILREVSLQVQLTQMPKCSIDQMTFGSGKGQCGAHEKGNTYGGQKCDAITQGRLVPIEVSAVACPGSLIAHVMSSDESRNYLPKSMRESFSPTALQALVSHQENTMEPEIIPAVVTEVTKVAPADPVVSETVVKEVVAEIPVVESLDLFAGVPCPACSRSEAAPESETETVKRIKLLAAEQISMVVKATKGLVEASNAKTKELQNQLDSLKVEATDLKTLREEFVQQTVSLMILKGGKTESQRIACTEELDLLPLDQVRTIRETYLKLPVQADVLKEKAQERYLQETSTESSTIRPTKKPSLSFTSIPSRKG